MKRFFSMLVLATFLSVLFSCTQNKAVRSSYVGTFVDEFGVKYELHSDSTTLITFNDSVTYNSTWSFNRSEDGSTEFVNLEFAGNQRYFYLKDGKLYRSERELRHDAYGTKIKYLDDK